MADRQFQQLAEPLADGPFLPAWQPQVVDQTPRVGRITAAVLATAIATFVVAPAPTEIGPAAVYPDRIHRPTFLASQQQAYTGPVAPLDFATPRTWAPTYPDRIPPRPGLLPALQPVFAANLEPIVSVPELSWSPIYPDRIPRRTVRAVDQQALAAHPAPLDFAVPGVWRPVYPDWIARRRFPTSDQQALAPSSEPITGAENARAAAVIGGNDVLRRPLLVQYVQLTGPVLVPAPVAPAPDLSWQPEYPDRLDPRVSLRVSGQQVQAFDPFPLTGPELRWQPIYPERIAPRVSLDPAAQQSLAWHVSTPAPAVEPDPLSWAGVYPAQPPQTPEPILVRAYLFAFVDTEPIFPPVTPIADLRWLPSTPDWLPSREIRTALQAPFAYWTEPIAAPVVAELSWAPRYPDRLPRRPFLVALQQVFAANVDPIATAAFVDLSWQPEFPDRLARVVSRLAAGLTVPPEDVTLVSFLGWLPATPEWLRRALPRAYLTTAYLPLQPRALANALSCLHLSSIEVTQATLLVQGLTQATILVEAISDESPPPVQVC